MKLLCIGNSFSKNACEFMDKIAAAGDFDLTTVNLLIPNCSLMIHCENIGKSDEEFLYVKFQNAKKIGKISLDEALSEDKYDVISVQQASLYSGEWESYEPYLTELVTYVRKLQPEAKIAVHQTWAYEVDAPHGGFANYERNRHIMHARLAECYERAAKLIKADYFIPCGNLIATLRDSWRFDPEKYGARLSRDGFHLGFSYGRYAAGLMWCAVLGMENIMENTFTPPFVDVIESNITAIKNAVVSMMNQAKN